MEIRKYSKQDEARLMSLLQTEGDEWACYWKEPYAHRYADALANSITYVACESDALCGYVRALMDHGFYIYVCDLLVLKPYRGRSIGRQLMERLLTDFPNQNVYVMSDVDEYYQKLGYTREGSVFEVKRTLSE